MSRATYLRPKTVRDNLRKKKGLMDHIIVIPEVPREMIRLVERRVGLKSTEKEWCWE